MPVKRLTITCNRWTTKWNFGPYSVTFPPPLHGSEYDNVTEKKKVSLRSKCFRKHFSRDRGNVLDVGVTGILLELRFLTLREWRRWLRTELLALFRSLLAHLTRVGRQQRTTTQFRRAKFLTIMLEIFLPFCAFVFIVLLNKNVLLCHSNQHFHKNGVLTQSPQHAVPSLLSTHISITSAQKEQVKIQ